MRIAIVGPGRLGRSLDQLWRRSGHVPSLFGRGEHPEGDVVVLTVPDREIRNVAALLEGDRRPVLHCSGVSSLEVLEPLPQRGSLHPLMTFPGPEISMPDLDGVPAAVDGIDEQVCTLAETLARDIGLRPVRVPGDRRLYHGAAVMAGNFATVLLAHAGRVLSEAGVDPVEARAMLAPLALTSLRNAVDDPVLALTGPLARGDMDVLASHRTALNEHGLNDLVDWFDTMVTQGTKLATEPSK